MPDLAPLETPAASPSVEVQAPPAEGSDPMRIAGLVVAGAGVVGIGLGAFFGLSASSKNSASNANGHCDVSGCDPQGRADRTDALSAARLATISFVAGGILLAGGGIMFFTARPAKPVTRAGALVIAPGVGTLSLHTTW